MQLVSDNVITFYEGAGGRGAGEAPRHEPVMAAEIVAALAYEPGAVFVDATVNGGGHASVLLPELPDDTIYVGLDVDPAALARARLRLVSFGSRLRLAHASFVRLGEFAERPGGRVANVLFDLGLSLDQLGDASRGFSFYSTGPVHMRFDGDGSRLTAAEVVNTFDGAKLADIIYELGEERRARAVARAIVRRRKTKPFGTAADLAEVVARAAGGRRGRLHPATRTFQALRIFVNDELAALEAALPEAARVLARGGRLFVISYHSLEDRIAKHFFRAAASRRELRILTPKPVRPEPEEVRANPRSRSARLRFAERI